MNTRWTAVLGGVFAVVVGLTAAADAAEIHEKAGTRAFPSLKIGVGAETIAMGEAGVALSDDAYSTYWNVAGLSRVRRTQIALMNNAWVFDIRQNYAAFAQPLGESSGVGAFLSHLDYGELVGRDESGAETGTFRPFDLAAGVGLGIGLGDRFALGVQGKYLLQEIDDASASGFAVDLGGRYDADSGLSVGVGVQHLGSSLQFDSESYSLPTTFRAGVGYKILDDRAQVALDGAFPADNDPILSAGVAYDVFPALTMRAGYRHEIGGSDHGTVSGIAGGFGVRFEGFALDYAFVSYGDLGPTNRVSVSASF